jgi:hypothetical protein
MFSFLSFDWLLGLIPTWLPWAIIGFGFALFLLLYFTKFLIPAIYRIPSFLVCICIVGAGAWLEGRQNVLSDGQRVIEKIVEKQVVVTKTVVQKLVERQEVVREVHDKITEQITTQDDTMCTVPESFVWLHDAAAQNTVPDPTTRVDGTPSGINLSEAERVIADNYEKYHLVAEQLKALQEWVREQKKISDQ